MISTMQEFKERLIAGDKRKYEYRKLAGERWRIDLVNDPQDVAAKVRQLLGGHMGPLAASLARARLTDTDWLLATVAALYHMCPADFHRRAMKSLDPKSRETLTALIEDEITRP